VAAALSVAAAQFETHRKAIDQTVTRANERVTLDELQVQAMLFRTTWVTGVLFLLTVLVFGATSWRIHHSIVTPIYDAVALVTQIADGNLDHDISVEGEDEFSQLHASLKEMQSSLVEIVLSIRRGAEHLATASAEISHANLSLSQRTEQQAAALEEVASSMAQLDAAVLQNATGAREANQLAHNASEIAIRGGNVVSEVVRTMSGINASSHRISDITNVINGIAFQTNILALNAAVEAARAGDQGRGFAVVAAEVRNLAKRAADAAKEIDGLITTSVQQVGQGSVLVDQAGTTMTEVVGAIEHLTQIMREISVANSEQSSGVSQVDGSVTQIDRSTQENAAMVEEMAASADMLSKQSSELVQVVSRFNTGSRMGAASVSSDLAELFEDDSGQRRAGANFDVDVLIDAHRQWKNKLTAAAEKHTVIDASTLSRDDDCGLGKWIYGDGQSFSNRPAFTRLVSHHAEFHKVAGHVGELINHQQFDQAKKELIPGSRFSKATIAVVHDLAAMKQALG
jgi:methyl-accepting chemotaxis protein